MKTLVVCLFEYYFLARTETLRLPVVSDTDVYTVEVSPLLLIDIVRAEQNEFVNRQL